MKKSKFVTTHPVTAHSNAVIETLPYAKEIFTSQPYVKFLPEATPEIRQQFLQASGKIEYCPTNNYMFQALFQENTEALTNLVCSVLHWPERSLGYLCRNFDNLNKGNNYTTVKSAIHIGFLNFTLFPNLPEFHATYKIQNIKNQNIYTDKFILHVIELNSIDLATKEDCDYEIDKWASFFKAKTWEDIRMLINENPALQSAGETLYQLNMNDQLRETCERFVYAEAEKNALNEMNTELKQLNAELKQTHAALTKSNAELEQSNAQLEQSNAQLEQEIADKDVEIARLKALLASRDNSDK